MAYGDNKCDEMQSVMCSWVEVGYIDVSLYHDMEGGGYDMGVWWRSQRKVAGFVQKCYEVDLLAQNPDTKMLTTKPQTPNT